MAIFGLACGVAVTGTMIRYPVSIAVGVAILCTAMSAVSQAQSTARDLAPSGGPGGGGGSGGGGGGGGSDRLDRIDRTIRTPREPASVPTPRERGGGGAERPENRDMKARGNAGGSQPKADHDTENRSGSSGGAKTETGLTKTSGSGSSGSGSGTSGSSGNESSSDISGSSGSGSSGSSGSGTSGSGTSGSSGSDSSDSSGSSDSSESGSSGSGSGRSDDDLTSSGGSNSLHDLAARERPDFDPDGFPARRGEVVSLDMTARHRDRAQALGFTVVEDRKLSALGGKVTRLRAPEGQSATEALASLRAEDDDAVYDYDHYYGLAGEADSPARTRVAALPAKPGKLWIGVIDTAISGHPSLRHVKVEVQDFSRSGNVAKPSAHGTAVASILAREGASRLTNANIFSNDPKAPFASADGIALALDWLVATGVPVINISIAGPRNAMLDRVFARVAAKGVVIVAAAGNNGPTAPPAYPAASAGVVAVTAVDLADRVYRLANQGNYISMAARGVGVPAAAPDGTLTPHSGTSFATPFISAHLAQCLGKGGHKRGSLCIALMQSRARDLGTPGRDPVYGFGLIGD